MSDLRERFPADFRFGVATSAYQIEGGARSDGAGLSVWDTFVRQPGTVRDGHTGEVACDSYHRLEEDLDLVAGTGVDTYRFSISWPRVLPAGTGPVNDDGLGYYDRLVDGLLERGIEPTATLYHWDLPQALQDRGGWSERATARAFAGYAAVVAGRLGDRVARWITLNEPWVVVENGHVTGTHAPGIADLAVAARAHHHLLLGHGLAVRALRVAGVAGAVGITQAENDVVAATGGRRDRDGARGDGGAAVTRARDLVARAYDDPVLGRGYPAAVHRRYAHGGGRLPVRLGDLDVIAEPLDLLGVNLYTRWRVAPDDTPAGYRVTPARGPTTAMGWEVAPDALGAHVRWLRDEYGDRLPPVWITENGMADDAAPDVDGEIRDRRRIDYLQSHLESLRGAIRDGVDVRGYIVWSLLDNFEWAEGFTKRFGLVWVDHDTGERSPKASYRWLAEALSTA